MEDKESIKKFCTDKETITINDDPEPQFKTASIAVVRLRPTERIEQFNKNLGKLIGDFISARPEDEPIELTQGAVASACAQTLIRCYSAGLPMELAVGAAMVMVEESGKIMLRGR